MNNLCLTLAIPTYNRSNKLNLLLNSISNQADNSSMDKIEIVISDNCSTDNTQETVNKFIKENEDLKIIYSKNTSNLGFDKNVHNSLKLSNGKYVWLIGDDDRLKDSALKTILSSLDVNEDYPFCFVNYDLDIDGKIYPSSYECEENLILDAEEMFIQTNFSNSFLSANIFNKSEWEKYNFDRYFDTAWYHFFASRYLVAGSKVVVIGKPQITQTGHNDFYSVRHEKKNEEIDGLEFYMSAHIKFLYFAFSLKELGFSENVINVAKKVGWKDNLRQIIFYKLTREKFSLAQTLLTINRMKEYFGYKIIFWLVHVPLLFFPKKLIELLYNYLLPFYKRFNQDSNSSINI